MPVNSARRAFAAASAFLALTAAAAHARADERKACVDAFDRAQQLRDQKKLAAARAELLSCSRDVCPKVVAKECAEAVVEIDRDQPTLAIRARDGNGKDVSDVKVLVDGAPLVSSLDGSALPIDPGPHKLRFVRDGSPDVEEDVVIRVGEKNRPLDVTIGASKAAPVVVAPPPPPAPTAERQGFHVPILAWVSLGVGAVGFGVMAGLAASASSDASALRRTCAPGCAQAQVDDVRARLAVANVAMIAGFVGVGGAVLTTVLANTALRPRAEARAAARPTLVALDVAPIAGGAAASVTGRF